MMSTRELPAKHEKEVVMRRTGMDFSCEHCRFSLKNLQEMAELGGKKEAFYTFGGRVKMNLYSVDTENGFIVMRRSTGKLTEAYPLKIDALIRVHDLIHSGEVDLDPHQIDEIIHMWGNYTAGLLRHLGCRKL